MPLQLVGRFVLQMAVAAVLFAVVAGIAALLWWFTEWLGALGVPPHITFVMGLMAELLFFLDVLCFIVFVAAETIRLVTEIVSDLWSEIKR